MVNLSPAAAAPPPLDATYLALANPTRRQIVERLGQGPATVGELAKPFPISLPAVSKHIGVLEQAGVVRRERRGRSFLCELVAAPLADAEQWLERQRQFWEHHLDRLGDFLDDRAARED